MKRTGLDQKVTIMLDVALLERVVVGKLALVFLITSTLHHRTSDIIVKAFSLKDDPSNAGRTDASRRNVWKFPVGVAAAYGYGRLGYNALSVQGIKYPDKHENQVSSSIATAVEVALHQRSSSTITNQPFRILEVGIGTDCRLIRRSLYDPAFQLLRESNQQRVELTGVDLRLPSDSIISEATRILSSQGRVDSAVSNTSASTGTQSQFALNLQKGSITSRLPFPNGYFDTVVCCLTMCSVDDPFVAAGEMKRLLKQDGGSLAYVEHVAVNSKEEPYRFLEFQQKLLDPLQQAVADNCHLHRYTEATLADVFGITTGQSRQLKHERFLVDSMWPVGCQCSGVLQLQQQSVAV